MLAKLYFDENMSGILAARLRKAGWDALTTQQARQSGKADPEQLEFATRQGRVLVTMNYVHFMALHEEWLREGRAHAGIVGCYWRPAAAVVAAKLEAVLRKVPPDEWRSRLQMA